MKNNFNKNGTYWYNNFTPILIMLGNFATKLT